MNHFKEGILTSYFHPLITDKFFFVHGLRTLLHSLLFVGFVAYQFTQPLFLNADIWVITYFLLFAALFLDFVGFYFYEKVNNNYFLQNLLLILDSVLVTIGFFCMSLPVLSSVLMYLYFSQIISAGFVGKYKGAFIQCLLISMLFSWVLILKPLEATGSSGTLLVFIIGNLLFLLAAGVGGLLGSQASKINWSLNKAGQALNELKNLNELIVQNIKMGLFITDEENTIVYANKQALRILNMPSDFFIPVHRVFPQIRSLLQSKGNRLSHIKAKYKSHSDIKTIEIFISPFLDNTDDLKRHLILFQDCTLASQEEEKEKEKEKFASIGRMAAGIAHELRNPLSSISGSIQLMDIHNKNSSENTRLMNIAVSEIHRLNNIIKDFLTYAGSEDTLSKVPFQCVQVNSVLEGLLEQVSCNKRWAHIHHYVTLKAHGFIEGHVDKFKQIFFNVVKNSCEAMENIKEGGNLSIETFDDNEWVVIRIKDTGTGISESDKPYIFDPFYSTKTSGSGLGLAVVHKLVSKYKGFISFETVDTGGTICNLRFPIQPVLLPDEMAKQQRKIA